MAQNNDATAETTVETTADAAYPSEVQDADAFAIVDDGEHAHIQAVWREDGTTVRVLTFYAESGDCDTPGDLGGMTPNRFDVEAGKSTEQWAQEAADIDPEVSLEIVREHFDN